MRMSDWSSDVCSSDLQRESGGSNRRAGIGAARRSLTALAGRLFCGNCGGKMTASGGHYVQCSTAVRTGGSICANKKNHRRDLIEARVFDGLDRKSTRLNSSQ